MDERWGPSRRDRRSETPFEGGTGRDPRDDRGPGSKTNKKVRPEYVKEGTWERGQTDVSVRENPHW